MNTTKQDLINLLNIAYTKADKKCKQYDDCTKCPAQAPNGCVWSFVADFLIANGVVIEERKKAHWITKNGITFCSECMVSGNTQWKRCPVCEAKMG